MNMQAAHTLFSVMPWQGAFESCVLCAADNELTERFIDGNVISESECQH